jgi:hypothetical protein
MRSTSTQKMAPGSFAIVENRVTHGYQPCNLYDWYSTPSIWLLFPYYHFYLGLFSVRDSIDWQISPLNFLFNFFEKLLRKQPFVTSLTLCVPSPLSDLQTRLNIKRYILWESGAQALSNYVSYMGSLLPFFKKGRFCYQTHPRPFNWSLQVSNFNWRL